MPDNLLPSKLKIKSCESGEPKLTIMPGENMTKVLKNFSMSKEHFKLETTVNLDTPDT